MTRIVIPDGGTIGSASDPDAISIASDGGLTFSGGIDNAGTISAGTIGTNVSFPTRNDFGVIESIFSATPLIDSSSNQDFTYTAGQEYCVYVQIYFTNDNMYGSEVYKIATGNTVGQEHNATSNVTPSISSAGTLRITTATIRQVMSVMFIRMDW